MAVAGKTEIDSDRWPGVARVPEGRLINRRAELAERSFHRVCARSGVSVEGGTAAGMTLRGDDIFARMAESGWLGLGESYLAGEWESEQLPEVLSRLISAGLDAGPEGSVVKRLRSLAGVRGSELNDAAAGELPADLIELYSGPLCASGTALFASGVRTTTRELIDNQARGAGRGGVPSKWSVDVSYVDKPKYVDRKDLAGGQIRRIEHLLDMGRVGAGDRVLEWPSTLGEIALRAADRGAGADIVTMSDDHATKATKRVEKAGLAGPVRVLQMESLIPSPRHFDSDYEAIFNVERLETFGRRDMLRWLRCTERLLVERGTAVVQMAVATDKFDATANSACDLIRSYIWPHLQYVTMDEFRKLLDRETGLRVAAESYLPEHMSTTLQLERMLFDANSREAAGLGYDKVYRRLWDYYLSLQQALIDSGRLTLVQLELIHAPRRTR